MATKPTRKNHRLNLNKDSLQPVSEEALTQIGGGATATNPQTQPIPCPPPSGSTTNPGCNTCY